MATSRGAFISRALASFIQYVGLIKAEFFDKDENNDTVFQAKFKELLQQYASITKWSYIGTKKPVKNRKYCDTAPCHQLSKPWCIKY
ncbi:hypothetical protein P167DRAFT_540447 [Morchella conica CCBAS932]|uniref:Uncharacterized protein n=1 Tax=Morchella conica CCBAS932 TaxID=1392247 RepID=A0A3N4KCF9_9PEZI|nr:hypothetical protein P167DRAFT_540447 [Morchella conica CCBAS932]